MKVLLGNLYLPHFEIISKYAELLGKTLYLYEDDMDHEDDNEVFKKVEEYNWYGTVIFTKDFGEEFILTDDNYDDIWSYKFDYKSHKVRTDPLLIQAFEEAENKKHLRVVEIPDDVEYHIYEYDDGFEIIRENHRTWR
jgi:hypothetical protein